MARRIHRWRIALGRRRHLERLKQDMGESLRHRPGANLTILADSRVKYGTLVQLFTLAKDVGIDRVNLAYREKMESRASP